MPESPAVDKKPNQIVKTDLIQKLG